jgi:predicted RNase H-like nuclease (RuvC/YqgF family)
MATLKIYNSIEDQEPCKVFTCYRTTMQLNNKLEELTDEINLLDKDAKDKYALITDKTTNKELQQIKEEIKELETKITGLTFEILQLFFKDFTKEDFEKLDPYDYQTFIFEVGEMRNKIYNRAAKN